MKDTKLFTLLRSISKEEFTEFHDFIISPIINKDENFVILYDYIKKNYSLALKDEIGKEKIYKAVFGKSEFNESKYWKLIFKTYRQISFIISI